jgi:hypothetical protein
MGSSAANSNALQFVVDAAGTPTVRATLDTSGNLGLGVTPRAWSTGSTIEVGNYFLKLSGSTTYGAVVLNNAYYNSGWKFAEANWANMYQTAGGVHSWHTSTIAGAAANDPITFTQAMTLDASGRWLLGTTTGVGNDFTSIRFNSAGSYPQGLNMVDSNASASGAIFQVFRKSDDTYLGNIRRNSTDNAIYVGGNSYLALGSGDTERARIDTGGNFGVGRGTGGDTTVGATLYADGTVTCARSSSSNGDLNLYVYSTGASAARFYVGMGGTVYATNTTISAISDQRFKENIQDLDVGLEKIMALKPRKFDWKSGKGKDIKGDRGFIAQELEQVFPDLVDEWADPAPEGEEPYKSVRQDLIPVLVKAIQELKADLDATKAELAALKGA